MLIPLTKMLSDRVGMLTFAAVAALSTVFLFAYRVSRTAEVVLYVIGSLILLFSASIIKAFAWGLVAKLPPPPFRQVVMSYNSAIYMFGRGTGAILGPAFHNESWFAVFIICLNLVACTAILLGFKLLTVPGSQ